MFIYRDTYKLRRLTLFCLIIFIFGLISIPKYFTLSLAVSFIFGIIAYYIFSKIDGIPLSESEIEEMVDYAEGYEENSGFLVAFEYIENYSEMS